jgi:hypothetical protein
MLQLHNLSFHYFILRYNSFAYLAIEKNQFLQKKYPSLLRSPALPVIQCDSAALFTDIQIIQKKYNYRNTNDSRTFAVFRTRLNRNPSFCPIPERIGKKRRPPKRVVNRS